MVISVILFLVYHILTITGEKMAKTGALEAFWGMWLSAMILSAIGLSITWMAAREISLTNLQNRLSSLFGFVKIFKFAKK